jgi:hypothetical protein
VLNEHPDIAEAVVVVREDAPGDKRLVAYLTLASQSSQESEPIESFLRRKLPDYLIPSSLVRLERLPLTSNGKVDRKGLPAVERDCQQLRAEYIQPKGELEQLIAGIWQGALNVGKVGREDNFFDLGGHSLLLAQVHGQLCRTLNKKLPLIKMLEHPTVSSLADFLSQERVDSLSLKESHNRAERLREGLDRQRRSIAKARYKA